MRGVLNSAAARDPKVARALAILSAFDDLVAAEADHREIAARAAELSGREVGVVDVWNDVVVREGPVAHPPSGPSNIDMVQLAPSGTPRQIDDRLTLAVEIASGRIGVVWLEAPDETWDELDHVVLERLAGTVGITAVRVHQRSTGIGRDDDLALERLLSGQFESDGGAVLVRRCGLEPSTEHVALAIGSSGSTPSSPEATTRAVADVLTRAGLLNGRGRIGDIGAIVAPAGEQLGHALADLAEDPRAQALRVAVGVGSAQPPTALAGSWAQARRALALAAANSDPGPLVVRYEDLGALALLSQIPMEDIHSLPDVIALRRLAEMPHGADDVALLRAYCETDSLRLAAARVHKHHSTVQYRLRRIEGALDIALRDPLARLRVLLALNLLVLGGEAS
jgi:hypothetical protein